MPKNMMAVDACSEVPGAPCQHVRVGMTAAGGRHALRHTHGFSNVVVDPSLPSTGIWYSTLLNRELAVPNTTNAANKAASNAFMIIPPNLKLTWNHACHSLQHMAFHLGICHETAEPLLRVDSATHRTLCY